MSNVGPVCHIPPTNQVGNPQPHDLPGLPGPISLAGSTGNAKQDAVNAAFASLLNHLLMLLRQLANQNSGQTNNVSSSGSKSKTGNWTEVNRVTSKVRVFQNNDPTSQNWVDVEQINQLTMQDKTTGNKWTWNR